MNISDFPKLLAFFEKHRLRLGFPNTLGARSPKRDAARSNRAGDANPPKIQRFRGISFPKLLFQKLYGVIKPLLAGKSLAETDAVIRTKDIQKIAKIALALSDLPVCRCPVFHDDLICSMSDLSLYVSNQEEMREVNVHRISKIFCFCCLTV